MPEASPPPYLQELNLEAEPLKLAKDSISDLYALSLVKETFNKYENFRTQNFDRRWNTHDALYFGWLPPKVWESTSIPRASLPHPISFYHIETALPIINNSLFGMGPEWFQVEAELGTSAEDARAVKDHLLYIFEEDKTQMKVKRANKSTAIYGNGGMELYWDEDKGRLCTENVSLKDFYIDPTCPSPSVDDCRSIIRRQLMTVEELDGMRDDPDMKIPSRPELIHMARNRTGAMGDKTKRNQEAIRGVLYDPSQYDNTPLPSDQRLEVLMYTSASRIIWVLNRQMVAYNIKNPYGFIPYVFAPCFVVPEAWYAQSYCDILEGPQRYGEALHNSHLDEITLALNPPRITPRSGQMLPSSQKFRPGANWQYDNPKDVQVLNPMGVTTNVFNDLQFLDVIAEKISGVNSPTMGIPRPGNANRTLGGMTSQVQGSTSRIQEVVSNIEDYLIVPLLEKAHKIIKYHIEPDAMLPAQGQSIISGNSVQKGVKFKMLAASKMLTRERLTQIFPLISQMLLTGPLIETIQKTGQTLNWEELFQMMQDATGVAKTYNLLRPMNEQEQQALNQPPPEVQAEMQKAQLESQTRLQMGQMKSQGEAQASQMDFAAKMKGFDVALQREDEISSREMIKQMVAQYLGSQDFQNELKRMAFEQQHEGRMNELEIQKEREKMGIERQKNMDKLQFERAKTSNQMQNEQASGSSRLFMEQMMHSQKLDHEKESNKVKLEQEKEKVKVIKQKASIGEKRKKEKK